MQFEEGNLKSLEHQRAYGSFSNAREILLSVIEKSSFPTMQNYFSLVTYTNMGIEMMRILM